MVRHGNSKLNEELIEKLTVLLEAGYPVKQATALCGVSDSAFYKWQKLGREGEGGIYERFAREVEFARRKGQAKMLDVIIGTATGEKKYTQDWKAAAWYLERTDPDNFARRYKMDQNVKAKVDAKVDARVQANIIKDLKAAEAYFKRLESGEDE